MSAKTAAHNDAPALAHEQKHHNKHQHLHHRDREYDLHPPVDFYAPLKKLGFDFWLNTCRYLSRALANVVAHPITEALFYIDISQSRYPSMWAQQLFRTEEGSPPFFLLPTCHESSAKELSEMSIEISCSPIILEKEAGKQPSGEDHVADRSEYGFVESRAHMCIVDDCVYPHSHVYIGMLLQGSLNRVQLLRTFKSAIKLSSAAISEFPNPLFRLAHTIAIFGVVRSVSHNAH